MGTQQTTKLTHSHDFTCTKGPIVPKCPENGLSSYCLPVLHGATY